MPNTQNYKYLVVEDEKLIRKNIIKKIESLGLPLTLVGEASNGMDAILLARNLCPDLVLTDIRMPQCDGIELSEYLYRNHPSTKIIILSGHNDFSYAQSAIRYAVKEYLLKPVTSEMLLDTLNKILISLESEHQVLEPFRLSAAKADHKSICDMTEAYLKENFSKDISFQELADRFGFTIEYMGKLFKRHFGKTPSKYLTDLRMNEAKKLLLNNPDMEIQKIGELVGYKDSFYFSRAFKTYTGIQPSEFRKERSIQNTD